MNLNINTNGMREHVARLERLHRSALPLAVRGALNSAAYDVKLHTMPEAGKAAFVERKPTFLKANSKVTGAKGFNIGAMEATVGFVPKQGNDKSVDDLEQQEHGGEIGGRSFVPLAQARSGGKWNRTVKASARISDVGKKIVNAEQATGSSDAERYIKSALHAGKGGVVLGTTKNAQGNRTLSSIRSIVRKGKNTVVKSMPLYAVKGGRKVRPAATHFMEKASRESSRKLESYFVAEANKQLAKLR